MSCFSTINQIVAQDIMGLKTYFLLTYFLFQNICKTDEPPYGSASWQSLARGGRVSNCELWTEGKFVFRGVLIKRYFGTSSPAAPDTDQNPRQKHTRHLPQKTNKGTQTTAARKYSPGSFCITTMLALQTLWHTWHHVPPHPHHSPKSIRTSLICRR